MWDAPQSSCHALGYSKRCFAKRKLDLNSIEYQSYIHRDVLGYLDKCSMPSKAPRPKKDAPKQPPPPPPEKKKPPPKSETKYQPVYMRFEKPQEEGKKLFGSKPGSSKRDGCERCALRGKRESTTSAGGLYHMVPEKCPMKYSELRRQVVKKPAAQPPESRKSSKAREEVPTEKPKRHPVLILRKKCYKKGEIVGATPSEALYSASLPSYGRLNFGKWKAYWYGEKGSGFKAKGQPQDFYRIRDECLDSGTLFEDPEFLANDSSLYFSQRPDRYYEWKRPSEICDNPQFFVEGYSRFDVQQGELGDCWLLAAAANLTLYNRLFLQIVPDDQDFDDKYAGVFHFRFWQYGKWVDVVIDDRLPTYRGELVFLHSTEENEFWSALLEKAYAKLHGSYEALKGGSTCEAMEDFTGGVTEMYELDAAPPNLFQIMIKAYERASLMGCSIEPDPHVVEAETPEGLVRGHAYSITRVQYVDIQTPNVTGKIPLLRLRNPWGNESEWNGAWSDGSPEWRFIGESEKEELGLTFDNDGEFWMSYKDFQKHFSRVEICNLNPDSLSEEEIKEGNKKKWEMSVYEGEWVRGVTAGGCRNFLDSFWHNPQYRITLTDVDEDDEDGNCTLIVALMQKNRRQIRSTGADLLTVGFAIYHLPYPDRVPKPLDVQFFKYNASVARSPSFINLREVSCRFKLPPGTYCMVPSTFDPNEEGEFLLRVFSEKPNIMEENDEEIGFGELDEKVANADVTEEEREETDKVYEVFLKLAGEDKEVDWKELKEILDYSMQDELKAASGVYYKKEEGVLSATPHQEEEEGFFSQLLGLICGHFCKDSPLSELVVKPNASAPLLHSFHDLTKSGFSKDICRGMIAMMDLDRSGKLGYEEFKNLWTTLRNWKNVWIMYDQDKSGSFNGFELREALHSAGYRLNHKVLSALMHRYGNKAGEIQFDDFMMCAIKVKTMMDIFRAKDQTGKDSATFTLEEWLEMTLYT
ncbi:calpain-A-like isoform X2 [Anthonomus grandis grandis]|uniref:calpain-A-like isoform X2 n=1 Tax=Anthonomus grandis grandis TaxID=2921223 RepID=UPI00216607F1|nr:calpain-A-like isoform X2 [Anthonomus grandis grandis]